MGLVVRLFYQLINNIPHTYFQCCDHFKQSLVHLHWVNQLFMALFSWLYKKMTQPATSNLLTLKCALSFGQAFFSAHWRVQCWEEIQKMLPMKMGLGPQLSLLSPWSCSLCFCLVFVATWGPKAKKRTHGVFFFPVLYV